VKTVTFCIITLNFSKYILFWCKVWAVTRVDRNYELRLCCRFWSRVEMQKRTQISCYVRGRY